MKLVRSVGCRPDVPTSGGPAVQTLRMRPDPFGGRAAAAWDLARADIARLGLAWRAVSPSDEDAGRPLDVSIVNQRPVEARSPW